MRKKIDVELCCGSVDDVLLAEKYQVARLELNHALELNGTTPTLGTLIQAKKLTSVPIMCMLRPRGVGYCHSELQYQGMLMDAKLMLENGADGIVFGFLHEDGSIDVERTKELVQLIHPKKAVYNKAADKTKDIIESVGILVECGVDRILTSGGAPYLDESKGSLEDINKGIETIKKLQELYGDKIEIMPGSGIREHNIERILTTTNTHCVHMAARGKILDPSSTHYMPKSDSIENYKYVGVSEEVLKRLLAKVEAISA